MTANNSILISPCNLSEQFNAELQSTLAMLSAEGLLFKVKSENDTSAHLLVIDVDTETGRQQLSQSLPGQVKLLISSSLESGKNVVGLIKPVTQEKLKNVLTKLFKTMQIQLSIKNEKQNLKKSSDKLNEADSNIGKVANNNINETVFYDFLMAKQNKDTLHVSSDELELYVDGENQSLKTKGTIDDVRRLISLPYNKINVKKIDAGQFQDKTQNLQVITLHNVLWTAAIICSNGMLLPGHDDNQAVKLRAWPSFTRNDFKAEHLKLAALLAQRPITLSDLSKQTDITYIEIVNFYNAAVAVDLIDKNPKEYKQPAKKAATNNNQKKSNLLNKIAARLGFSQHLNGTYSG